MEFHSKLQRIRKEHGMSQEELAGQLGVSRQAVSKWENGQGYPETEKLLQLSNLFGVSLDYLLKDEQPLGEDGEPDDGSYYASREAVDSFLLSRRQRAAQLVLGVAVLILSLCWAMVVPGAVGTVLFMLSAAIGVGILVMTGFRAKRYAPEIETRPLLFDPGLLTELRARYQTVRRRSGIAITSGIVCAIAGLVASYVLSVFGPMAEGRGGFVLFLFAAVGVGLMMWGGLTLSAWNLLVENDKHMAEVRQEKQMMELDNGESTGWVYGAFMILATVAFLGIGLTNGTWHPTWLVYPAAVALGLVVTGILRSRKR